MPSLWNSADEAAIRQRIEYLQPQSKRQWGTMSVDQMMRHLAVAYNSATGKVTLPDEGIMATIVSLKPITWLMINVMPWPKGLPTAASFIIPDKISFDDAKTELTSAFNDFMASKTSRTFGSHPLFGSISYEDWGTLLYKHTDHHLRQFGV